MSQATILIVGPSTAARGGIARVVEESLALPLAKRYRLRFLSTFVDGSKSRKLVHYLGSLGRFAWLAAWTRPDLLHIHTAHGASFYRKSAFVLLGRLLGRGVVLHMHSSTFVEFYRSRNALGRWYVRRILRATHKLVALTESWKEQFAALDIGPLPLVVVPNPVDVPDTPPRRTAHEGIVVLTLGRLCAAKGTYDTLEAAKVLAARHPEVRFRLAGDGEVEQVREQAARLGIPAFEVGGWVQDTEPLFAEADIFLLPSYHEGLPVSLIEAASHGLPAVATDVGGVRDVVVPEETGLLIAPGDVDGLVASLTRLIVSQELRERLGRSALARARARFDQARVAERLERIYAEVLEH